jgi:uncharacterized protein
VTQLSAEEIIALLELTPHPEGGHYRETFRDQNGHNGRAHGPAIYFLLRQGERSHWHRVDAAETWHWYAGAPLELNIAHEGERTRCTLGRDLKAGDRPQAVVPPHAWQSAKSLGQWTLCGCTVAPGFDFSGFVLAPPDFEP